MSRQRTTYKLIEAVVAELAPEEVELLPDLWAGYVEQPDPDRAGERLLGSGVLADVAGWAPLVMAFIGAAVLEACKQEITDRTRGLFRRRARREAERRVLTEPLALTDDQRRRVVELVRSHARAMDMPPERSRLLTDAVAGALERGSESPEP